MYVEKIGEPGDKAMPILQLSIELDMLTVGAKKTVMFSFRSVHLERKRNAHSICRKRTVPFPKMLIEWWATPRPRVHLSVRMYVRAHTRKYNVVSTKVVTPICYIWE